jgi:putative membrane protein
MKIATVLAAIVLAGTVTGPAFAADKADAFVAAAAQANMTEIELSKLALQKAKDPRVRDFAQHMIDDHTKTGNMLALVAKQEHIPLPDTLDAGHAAEVAGLTALTANFDRAYVDAMVADHASAVALFGDFANTGQDLYLKTFAQNTLPALTAHKATIEALQAKM